MSTNSMHESVPKEILYTVKTTYGSFSNYVVEIFSNKKFYPVLFITLILYMVYRIGLSPTEIRKSKTLQYIEEDLHVRNKSSIYEENSITKTKFETLSIYDVSIACQIPRQDPWDPTIKNLTEDPQKLDCEDEYPLMFSSTLNSTIIPVRSPQGNESLQLNGQCCYQVVTRQDKSKTDRLDNSYELSETCYKISLESETIISPEHDHIAIKCEYHNFTKEVNTSTEKVETFSKVVDMHTFIHLKPEVEERVKNITTTRLIDGSLPEDALNVVIFGIDSVSHMNFVRVMPSTYRFLMNNLSAVEMNGYNKIGDNTFPNMGAALAGVETTVNTTLTCEVEKAVDDCPMIWKKYLEYGYHTAYGEDATWMGIFNYLKKGFNNIPTDYYFRPFGRAAGDIIGTHKKLNAKECYGPRMQFDVVLNYMQKMAYTMGHDRRYFQLMWSTSLTHDLLNEGKLGDQLLLSTFVWFHEQGYLNNTMFILMSDHGMRYGKILDFPAGKLELSIPFLFFISPPWFREKYSRAYENLKINRNLLTTPFDLHQTLNDLVNLDVLNNKALSKRESALASAVSSGLVPRGISQFLLIPFSRTCDMAGVPDQYCICHQTSPLPVDNSTVLQAANYAVHYMNSLVSAHSDCSYLTLTKVKSSQLSVVSDRDFLNQTAYEISFETSPGEGNFDASLIKNSTGFWLMSGTIGRTNLYGNQSHCVDDKELKLYCYCVDLL